jgi:hypothetical protein
VLWTKAVRRKKSAGDGSFCDEDLRITALRAGSQIVDQACKFTANLTGISYL